MKLRPEFRKWDSGQGEISPTELLAEILDGTPARFWSDCFTAKFSRGRCRV
jgi:hypothetical protein